MPRHFRIHPAIGTARMGDSPNHFIGAETAGAPGNSDDGTTFKSFRDAKGRILRQGAQFRVFEYDEGANGSLMNPREILIAADVIDIEWRVHLANRKASFYSFYGQFGADDRYVGRSNLPATQPIKPKPADDDPQRTNLRNSAFITAADRAAHLEIDPGEQLISQSQKGPIELTNTNKNIPITSLGTLQLGDNGRLIVLGGYGQANSTENPPRQIDEYASNDTWFDDAGDGSVKARVRLSDGTFFDADPAWVLVGPPDFAPGIGNVVSLRDTLWDTAVREIDVPPSTPLSPMLNLLLEQKTAWKNSGGKSLAGFKPSFTRDVFPIVKRALGATNVHQSGTTENPHYHEKLLTDWALMSTLTGPSAENGAVVRQTIFGWLRNPTGPNTQWKEMPRGLGDDYTLLDAGTPTYRSFLSLTRIQYAILEQWQADNFFDDWPGTEPVFTPKANPTPDDLDCAAVENSVGGPFYPGIEVSWLIRVKELFSEPFRLIIPREPEDPKQTAATPLTVGALVFKPGFFSQQMALPWHADFYDCHKEEWNDPVRNDYFFMWWTAQRPDDVFPSGGNTKVRWVRRFDDPKQVA